MILFSGDTTESELCRVFSAYGNVKSTKIIVDRAGVSKGYGFVTFETEQEAQRLQSEVSICIEICIVVRSSCLTRSHSISDNSLSKDIFDIQAIFFKSLIFHSHSDR